MTKKFKYTKSIDKKIAKAIAAVLKVDVLEVYKIKKGEVNHVYKIVTSAGNFLARVFQYDPKNRKLKLEWIETQLLKNNIPHAKVLYYSKSKTYFPYGFMFTEFIDGHDGRSVTELGVLGLGKAYYQIGKALKSIHKISLKEFGKIQGRKFKSLLEFKLFEVKTRIELLTSAGQLTPEVGEKVVKNLINILKPLEDKLKPVLNHGDPNRENGIWSNKKQWVLIDWDNALISTWIEDYADLTFWANFKKNDSYNSRRLAIFKKNFFLSHGKMGLAMSEINTIEYALHLVKCLKLMNYYYFKKNNIKEFNLVRDKLLFLLKNNLAID